MTINETSLEFEMYDPITQKYLCALPTPYCAVGELALVDKNDKGRNVSTFKIYRDSDKYFQKKFICC